MEIEYSVGLGVAERAGSVGGDHLPASSEAAISK